MITEGGTELLLISYPEIGGDAPIAEHCRALVTALRQYAESEPLEIAANALKMAVAERHLFSFSRHHFCIKLNVEQEQAGILCTITITLSNQNGTILARTMISHWNGDGTLQRRASRSERKKESLLPQSR